MNNSELLMRYWPYYLALERRFLETDEFVEINKDNHNAFSNGFAMLIQAIGAELDNVFKVYCGFDLEARKNISDYAKYVLEDYPCISSQRIIVNNTDIELVPFENWNATEPAKSLPWWAAFDDIKHNRCGKIKEANQGNTLEILSALFLIEMKCFMKFVRTDTNGRPEEPDIPYDASKLFTIVDWNNRYTPIGSLFAVVDGALCVRYKKRSGD